MIYSPSLDEIVAAWRENTKKKYPEDHPMYTLLSQQGQYIGKSSKAIDVRYSPVINLASEPWSDIVMYYNNDSSVEQSVIYESTEEVGVITTTTLEKSLEIGVEAKVNIDLTEIADMEEKISLTGGNSTTQATQRTVKDTKRLRIPFKAPAHTKVSAQAFATKKKFRVNWTSNIAVGGIWTSSYHEGHNSASVSLFLPELVAQTQLEKLIEVSGWHSCSKSLREQKVFWGADWPYGDALKNLEGSTSIPFVWGEISGTTTYEKFVDIKISVNELGPADNTVYAPAIYNYADDVDQCDNLFDIAHICELDNANVITSEECGFLLESLLIHMAQR